MFHPSGPSFFELARQALSSTERGYDLLAPKFDYTPFRTSDVFLQITVDYLKNRFGSFDSALDVCCGTGAALEAVRGIVTGRLCGIDMSRGMLDVAEKNLAASQAAMSDNSGAGVEAEFLQGNVLEMPFEDEFDLAISFGAFGHIRPVDEQQFVEQVAQALKPGGRFVFVTHLMPSMWSPAYWLARGFNGAMHARNLLIRPPFVMFYLTFLWPQIEPIFNNAGFDVESVDMTDVLPEQLYSQRGSSTFTIPVSARHMRLFKLIVATRR